jgi:hypothetical protein
VEDLIERGVCRTSGDNRSGYVATPDGYPATSEHPPVGASEIGVAQGVAHRIDGTVDVAQPITCSARRNTHAHTHTHTHT